jgi:uncharacterized membrane protein
MTPGMQTGETPRQRRSFRLLASLVLGLTLTIVVWIGLDPDMPSFHRILLLAGAALATNKLPIFAGLAPEHPFGFGPLGIGLTLVVLDSIYAVTLAAGIPILENRRWIGPVLQQLRRRAKDAFLQFPGLQRMAYTGVALFVLLPLPGSGAISGAFAGRLMGLSRYALCTAVITGSMLNCFVFVLLAKVLGAQAQNMLQNPRTTIVAGALSCVLLWLAWRRVKKILREG